MVHIIASHLARFNARFFEEPSSGLLSATAELGPPVASISFSGTRVDDPAMAIYVTGSDLTLDRWLDFVLFQIEFYCYGLDVQVTSAGQICTALTPMLSAMEGLYHSLDGGHWNLGDEGDIEDATWRNLLRPHHKVEKLQIDCDLMNNLSLALCLSDNGPTTEILLELCKLTRPDYTYLHNVFGKFIAA